MSESDGDILAAPKFSIDQLMELAGLSCAQASLKYYTEELALLKTAKAAEIPTSGKNTDIIIELQKPRVVIFCGPGNNGGDGLVCARHLFHFGFHVDVVYPKRTNQPIYANLVKQLTSLRPLVSTSGPEESRLGVSVVNSIEDLPFSIQKYDMIIDAVFGFGFTRDSTASSSSVNKARIETHISSFRDFFHRCSDTIAAEKYIKSIRSPFQDILEVFRLYSIQAFENGTLSIPIVSIDVPSGWDVDQDGRLGTQPISFEYVSASFNPYFIPTVLISLSYPKRCAYAFETIQVLSKVEKTMSQSTNLPPMKHYLGGRFIPRYLQQRYGFSIGAKLQSVSLDKAVMEPSSKKIKTIETKDTTVWYHGSEQITEIVQYSLNSQ